MCSIFNVVYFTKRKSFTNTILICLQLDHTKAPIIRFDMCLFTQHNIDHLVLKEPAAMMIVNQTASHKR